jgi:DNA-directed RNA polymerase subunit RPC12/RpoP
MFNRRYVFLYGLLTMITLIAGITPLILSGRADAGPILVVLLVALAIPPALIWLTQKLGYPIGRPLPCPRCGTEIPLLRKPSSIRQGLWGGYTCPKCGAEMDAMGKELG